MRETFIYMDSNELSRDELEDELESHLKGCADKIRNAVDKTDYKDVILPVVFYKSVSDTYKDEYEEAKKEYGEEVAGDEQFHTFQIPEEYLWENALKQNKNIGEFLNEVFEHLERENPEKLQGAFNIDYAGEQGLDDSRLRRLLQHLDKHNMSAERLPPDVLGEAYMDLVRHFAEEEGRDGGEFFTPPHIVKLMIKLIGPFEKGDSFHDPTAGSGGMLIEAARYFKEEQGGDPSKLRLTGQEVNPDITAIGKINIFLHNYNGDVKHGDSLSNPQFLEQDGELEKFDYILANFPFSSDWDKYELQEDKYERFNLTDKLPRADRGDYAFIMHMLSQLEADGKMATVAPLGVLSRSDEQVFRKPLIDRDLVESVIILPEKLFQNNDIPSAIIILNKDKKDERKEKVQFIYAAREGFYKELDNQNQLLEEGISRIVRQFDDFTEEEKFSQIVENEEIKERGYNLNVALYVNTNEPESKVNPKKAFREVKELQEEQNELMDKLDGIISQLKAGKKSEDFRTNGQYDIGKLQELDSSPVPGWKIEILGNVLEMEYGENLPEDDREPGETPVYGSNGIVGSHSTSYVDREGLIVGRKGSVGEVDYSPEEFWPIDTTYYVTDEETSENLIYLKFLLQSLNLRRLNADSAVPGLSRNDAYGLNALIPPQNEQENIASIIEYVEDILKQNKRLEHQLSELKRGLMQDLLDGSIRTEKLDIKVHEEVNSDD